MTKGGCCPAFCQPTNHLREASPCPVRPWASLVASHTHFMDRASSAQNVSATIGDRTRVCLPLTGCPYCQAVLPLHHSNLCRRSHGEAHDRSRSPSPSSNLANLERSQLLAICDLLQTTCGNRTRPSSVPPILHLSGLPSMFGSPSFPHTSPHPPKHGKGGCCAW